MDKDSKIFGHLVLILDGIHNCLFEFQSPFLKVLVAVESASVPEASCPGIDARDAVSGGGFALLVEPVVAGNRAVGCLGFDAAVGADKDARHQPQRAKALRQGVKLNIPIIVLTGPHEPAFPLDHVRDHRINQPMFVF